MTTPFDYDDDKENRLGAKYRSEYVGFTANETSRDYTLRVTAPGVEARDFTVVVFNEAFLARRVRYQDAPGICFLKLQRALAEGVDLVATRLTVTDAELEEYRETHAPRPSKRRPRYPVSAAMRPPEDLEPSIGAREHNRVGTATAEI